MNTLNQLIYNIRTLIRDNKSDDLKFTDRNIEFWIKYIRTKLIRQDIQKGRSFSDNIVEYLPNIPLISVDKAEDNNITIGSNIIRTGVQLPKPISGNQQDMIISVSGLDRTYPISIMPKVQAIRNKYNKYGNKLPVAFYDNKYIYILGCNILLENITVAGIFEDPREVYNFNNPNGIYNPDLEEYPMEGHMIDMMNSIIKRNELDLYFQIPEDKVNDAQTNI